MYKFHPYIHGMQVVCDVLAYSPADFGYYSGLPEDCEPDEPVVFEYVISPATEEDADHEIFSRPLTWSENRTLLQQFEAFKNEF